MRLTCRFKTGQALLLVPAMFLLGACPFPVRAQGTGAPTGVTARPQTPAKPLEPGESQGPKTGIAQQPERTAAERALKDAGAVQAPVHTEEGRIGDSSFRIDVPNATPASWNRKLIVYFHGYQSEPQLFRLNPVTGLPYTPLRQINQLLLRGYAVAQPGYAIGGWAIATAPGDGEALRRYFSKHYSTPQQTFVMGQSMGGLLTVLTLEQRPHDYAGGLALCGVLTPADLINERAFANRVAFDAFFPGVLPDVEHIPASFRINDADTATLVQKALDAHPTEAALLRSLADIHTNRGLADVLVFNTFLIKDLREKAGGNPFDNRNLIYTGTTDDNALNARVRRYAGDPKAMRYVAAYGSPSGDLRRPLLALHTTYDPLVPASTAGYYDELTRRLGVGERFVQQYVNRDGHCNITPEQAGLAFDELVGWVNGNVRPVPGRLPDDAGQKPVHQDPVPQAAQPKNIGKPE